MFGLKHSVLEQLCLGLNDFSKAVEYANLIEDTGDLRILDLTQLFNKGLHGKVVALAAGHLIEVDSHVFVGSFLKRQLLFRHYYYK